MSELGGITGGGLTGFGIIILHRRPCSPIKSAMASLMILAFADPPDLRRDCSWRSDPIFKAFGKDGRLLDPLYRHVLVRHREWRLRSRREPYGRGAVSQQQNALPQHSSRRLAGRFDCRRSASYFMNGGSIGDTVPLGKVHWLIQMSMFLVPTLIYGLMCLGQTFPRSEASQAGVSYAKMFAVFLSPIFFMLLLIHALVGYVELGTDSWIGRITGSIMGDPTRRLASVRLYIGADVYPAILRRPHRTYGFAVGPLVHQRHSWRGSGSRSWAAPKAL